MNYKQLFPTYRARHRFVARMLKRITGDRRAGRILNVGCGEGDIDPLLASFADELWSCDVNAADVAHARAMNSSITNVRYSRQRAEALDHEDASFDAVCLLEVIEHVDDPQATLAELARVLRPGGHAIVTCPSERFPFTYDPINHVLQRFGAHLPIGAYAYGHTWLVREEEIARWFADHRLHVVHHERLSGPLAGLAECYVPGLVQKVLKANAANKEVEASRRFVLKPRGGEPRVAPLVDAFVRADERLLGERSVGLGYVLTKSHSH